MTWLTGRFYKAELEGFPEVTVYNYKTNTATRGINNTDFRFQETYIDGGFLMYEMTDNGSFETNSGVTTVSTLYSGSSVVNSLSGWTVSGNNTYLVGASGYTFPTYGYAFPFVGNYALYLHPSSDTITISSENSIPVTSDTMAASENYQMYFVGRSQSGSADILLYLEGLTSSASEYYSFQNNIWQTTVPTGVITLSTGYTEYIKEFSTINFDSNVPTGYKLHIVYSGQSPITLDALHIDKFGLQNPYLDYILPTGYVFEITPDLGWHDVKEMFLDTENNPFINTIVATQSAGNLIDNLDGSISVVLTPNEMSQVLYAKYKKYYWRATALSPNGTLGLKGTPVSFEWVGPEFSSQFKITKVQDDINSVEKIVVGTKPKNALVYINGALNTEVSYPSELTWRYKFILPNSRKKISFQAVDVNGATSDILYRTFSFAEVELNKENLWNVFDEFGLLANLERLPNENNQDYSERIKRAFREQGGSTIAGITNTATRELGFYSYPSAISVSYNSGVSNVDCNFEVTSTSLVIKIANQKMTEIVKSDAYGHIYLQRKPVEDTIELIDLNTQQTLASNKYRIDYDDLSVYRLDILDLDYYSTPLRITYEYSYEIFFSEYPLLVDIINYLNSLTVGNKQMFTASLDSKLSGGEKSKGLYKLRYNVSPGDTISFQYSSIYIDSLADQKFRDSFKNSRNSLLGTQYYTYLSSLKTISRVLWGNLEADRDYLDFEQDSEYGQFYLPTITDPLVSDFNYSGRSIDSHSAWYYSYSGVNGPIVNNLLTSFDFIPGVATDKDLSPGLFIDESYPNYTQEQFFSTSPERRSNTGVFFSGKV